MGDFDDVVEVPKDIYNPNRTLYIRRLYNIDSYNELIERLENIIEKEGDDYYYDINIRYTLFFKNDEEEEIRTKVYTQVLLSDLIEIIIDYIGLTEERYENDIGEREIIKDIFLKQINPWFGSSIKMNSIFRIINGKTIYVKFYNTYDKCLIKSVLKSLNLDENKHSLINHYDRYKDKDFSAIKRHLEKELNVKIRITKCVKNLAKMLENKKEDEVILFSTNKHVGFVEELLPNLRTKEEYEELKEKNLYEEKKKKKDKFLKYGEVTVSERNIHKEEIIYGTCDCEFEYDKKEIKHKDGTKSVKHISKEPNLICLKLSNGDEKVFENFKKFMGYLQTVVVIENKDIYIYSHNGMRVEHQFIAKEQIMQYIRKGKEPQVSFTNIQGSSIKTLNWKVGNNKIRFYDTLLYMKMPLEDIAKTYKLSVLKGHKDMKNDMTKEEKDEWYLTKKWDYKNKNDIEYCMNDCKILYEFIERFNDFIIKTYDDYYYAKDAWALVKSSVSAINKQYVLNKYPNIINNTLEASIFADSYFGGRNECFYIGEFGINQTNKRFKGKIISKDINSSYPYELLKGFAGEFLYEDDKIPKIKLNNKRWLALVDLSYKEKYTIPPLCVKDNGKLLFPNIMNSRKMFIWDCEYEEIKDNLNIHKIDKVYYFRSMNLEPLIKKLFDLKQSIPKDSSQYKAIKILINGIYGCLGMNSFRQQKMIISDTNSLKLAYDEYETAEAFEGLKWLYYSDLCSISSAFQCASSVTAQGRLHLWKYMNYIKELGNKVLYCDTDSVYFIGKNWEKDESSELGKWDEHEHDYMKILSCKVYILDNEIKFKGLHPDLAKSLKSSDIFKNCEFYNKQWRVCKDNTICQENILKKYNLEYTKAYVRDSGRCVPFDF